VEIIKASDIPLETLLNLINNAIPEPKWPDVVLPAGMCIQAPNHIFEALTATQQMHPSFEHYLE
jgi:hypothetical protein